MRKLAAAGRLAGFDRNKLGDEFRFVDVQAATLGIGKSPGADFRRAGMIDDAGIPGRLDSLAERRHAAARLAGHDDLLDRQRGKIDVVLGGDFGQAQGVGGRAE